MNSDTEGFVRNHHAYPAELQIFAMPIETIGSRAGFPSINQPAVPVEVAQYLELIEKARQAKPRSAELFLWKLPILSSPVFCPFFVLFCTFCQREVTPQNSVMTSCHWTSGTFC
ncbi:MAG TPA: hypothetical protein V6C81_19280, partial [Planktothrix sp.]